MYTIDLLSMMNLHRIISSKRHEKKIPHWRCFVTKSFIENIRFRWQDRCVFVFCLLSLNHRIEAFISFIKAPSPGYFFITLFRPLSFGVDIYIESSADPPVKHNKTNLTKLNKRTNGTSTQNRQ